MDRAVRAFSVLPGKEDELRELAGEMSAGRAGAVYRHHNVHRESWHLQRTEHGAIVIAVVEGEDLERIAAAYATSEREADRWLKDRVREITGINLDEQPLGPPTETVFDWCEDQED